MGLFLSLLSPHHHQLLALLRLHFVHISVSLGFRPLILMVSSWLSLREVPWHHCCLHMLAGTCRPSSILAQTLRTPIVQQRKPRLGEAWAWWGAGIRLLWF